MRGAIALRDRHCPVGGADDERAQEFVRQLSHLRRGIVRGAGQQVAHKSEGAEPAQDVLVMPYPPHARTLLAAGGAVNQRSLSHPIALDQSTRCVAAKPWKE